MILKIFEPDCLNQQKIFGTSLGSRKRMVETRIEAVESRAMDVFLWNKGKFNTKFFVWLVVIYRKKNNLPLWIRYLYIIGTHPVFTSMKRSPHPPTSGMVRNIHSKARMQNTTNTSTSAKLKKYSPPALKAYLNILAQPRSRFAKFKMNSWWNKTDKWYRYLFLICLV